MASRSVDLQAGSRVCALLLFAALCACAAQPLSPAPPPPLPPPPSPVSACRDVSFPIYFETNSAELTADARKALAYAADRLRGCLIGSIEVVGLADPGGGARRNRAVSQARADKVVAALKANAISAPDYRVEGIAALSGGGDLMRRRADVVIRAARPPSR